MTTEATQLKRKAAVAAVQLIEPGMVVGLGGGSTAEQALIYLAELLHSGALREIIGIPCSRQVEANARRLGVPLTTLAKHPVIDLTIDGADEVDPELRLIKGGGGALLREKIVAQASQREVIVVDESKRSPVLGTNWALPVEVIPFGWPTQQHFLETLGAEVSVRTDAQGQPFCTDEGNMILDCDFGPIHDPERLAATLARRAGIVAHGLFLGLVDDLIVASRNSLAHERATRPQDGAG